MPSETATFGFGVQASGRHGMERGLKVFLTIRPRSVSEIFPANSF